ncbi:MAG: hypothetical protein J6I40_07060 [Mailhella sp.]|nr:hypothetical protein [Mailhella sp.]
MKKLVLTLMCLSIPLSAAAAPCGILLNEATVPPGTHVCGILQRASTFADRPGVHPAVLTGKDVRIKGVQWEGGDALCSKDLHTHDFLLGGDGLKELYANSPANTGSTSAAAAQLINSPSWRFVMLLKSCRKT